jgi:Na+-transporting NADH:ubiquinone oxidoreductase subunit B
MNIKGLFQKQKMMRTVLMALIPLALMAVYLFGWRVVPLFFVVALAAVISEYLVMRTIQKEKTRVSEAALVSAALFTLTLPPQTPFWIAVVGIVFGIVFGKAAFGGFGRNIFNPALVGRCFIYIAFPTQMTMTWATPFGGLPGGFASWGVDAVTTATPIITYNSGGAAASYSDLLFGFVGGSLGETSALLLILVGAYLVYKKVASWQIMVSTVVSGGILASVLHYAGVMGAHGVALPPPLFTLLTGGFLFGAVLMATDPVSAPRSKTAQWIAGSLIGLITVVIRSFALFTEGMMFAILIVNALTPLIELQLKQRTAKAKKSPKEAAA